MFCQEYWAEKGLETLFPRFHNAYGPNGTWDGGREKAPAAICRKVIEAKDTGKHEIVIWAPMAPRPEVSCTSTIVSTASI